MISAVRGAAVWDKIITPFYATQACLFLIVVPGYFSSLFQEFT